MGEVISMTGCRVTPVEPLQVALDYPQLANMLRAAAAAHPYEDPQEVDNIMCEAQAGRALIAQVMMGAERLALLAVEIKTTIRGRVLWVRYCSGGNMEVWLDQVMDWLQEVARSESCDKIGLMGRKGWVRELSRFGYSPVATQLVCEVKANEWGNRKERESLE